MKTWFAISVLGLVLFERFGKLVGGTACLSTRPGVGFSPAIHAEDRVDKFRPKRACQSERALFRWCRSHRVVATVVRVITSTMGRFRFASGPRAVLRLQYTIFFQEHYDAHDRHS